MNLHAEIMNLPTTRAAENTEYSNRREAYMHGHRDARHAAAELALMADAELEALQKDAERYRWLKSRKGLDLRTEPQPNVWRRLDGTEFCATHSLAEGGTQHAPADSLDATIDAAMQATRP